MENTTISLVIPTYSQQDKLKRLLSSLDSISEVFPKEVIIVNDCSTDGTIDILERWSKNDHKYIPLFMNMPVNSGPAVSRNIGMSKAVGNVIAFTDSDCIVSKFWLREIVKPLDKKKQVIGVGGKVLPVKLNIISRYSEFHRILEPPTSMLYLVTANCCFYRDELSSVKGFDEQIRRPGGEDIGLSIKLIRRGWKFAFAESAIVYHEFRNSLFDFYNTYKNYGIGCAYVAQKYLREMI